MQPQAWARAYERLAAELPAVAPDAPLTLCGMGSCTDARASLHDMQALLATHEPAAKALADLLVDRAARGIGGEVRLHWPEGAGWLNAHERFDLALGGTGPQAAWTLAALGAPALVALEDRSAHMLAQVPGNVLLAEGGRLVARRDVQPRGRQRPDIFIIEYARGIAVRGHVPPRSSRIIVRFADLGIEHDEDFARLSVELAGTAGAGLVSGLSAVASDRLDEETAGVFALTRRWREAGLEHIHLELAGYETPDMRDRVMAASAGAVTSLGMSHSEFLQLMGDDAELGAGMAALGNRLGLARVCVHADEWAASLTRGAPAIEARALMAGCLLASTRAAAGRPAIPHGVPAGATFEAPPQAASGPPHGWSFVSVAAPHLAQPAGTVGLGDTFTAGCLLVLGLGSGGLAAHGPETV